MVKKGTCGLCQGGCAVVYTIENGKIVKAEPDKESPKGRLCTRGALVPDILYGEERIKRPLIRVGERGEGKFRECSWEEAVDKAAELLKKTADTYGDMVKVITPFADGTFKAKIRGIARHASNNKNDKKITIKV